MYTQEHPISWAVGVVSLALVAVLSGTASAQIPYASSYAVSGEQIRELDAQEQVMEAKIEDISSRLKKAKANGEDVTALEQELAAAQTELHSFTHLSEDVMPYNEHMVERLGQIEDLVPGRDDPEPIPVEKARRLRALFYEDMGHPEINRRWQGYLVDVEIGEATSHPDLSRETAKELRDTLLEVYYADRQYYSESDVLLSVDFMGNLAAALYRVSDPGDTEARQVADHLAERTLTWAESLQDESNLRYYGRVLGGLQEAAQLMDEAVPEWLETELQAARDPGTTTKLKRIEDAVQKTKETARRDARNVERIKEVVAYGQADYGKAEWNASMLRMQLVFIRTVLSKSRKEVSDEVVKYLCKTLGDMAVSGRINGKELLTLWAEAVRALYRRAETPWEVKMNRESAETDFPKPEVKRTAISELLRAYMTILGKSPRLVPKEVVSFIDRHLLELAKGESERRLTEREHWILWSRAAIALGPDRASEDMKRFVGKMRKEEKDPTRRGAYRRVWERLRTVTEDRPAPRPPTSAPTTSGPATSQAGSPERIR